MLHFVGVMKTCKNRSQAQFKALNEKETIRFLLRKLQDKEAELCYVKSVVANGGRLHSLDDGSEAPWRRQSVACQTDAPVELSPLPVPSIRRSTALNLLVLPGKESVGRRRSFYSALAESRQEDTAQGSAHPYGLQLKSFSSFSKPLKGKDRYRRSSSSPATCGGAQPSENRPFYNDTWRDSLEAEETRIKIEALVAKQEEIVQGHVSEVECIQSELLQLLELHDASDVDPSQHELEKIEFIQHEVDYKTSVAMFLEEGLQELLDISHALDSLFTSSSDQYSDSGNQESV